jgi:hypothetical protein
MPLVPNNSNPLQDYVTPGQTAAMTVDGIVVDRVYANTGIIDSLNINNLSVYQDPTTNQVSLTGQIALANTVAANTGWTSELVDDTYNYGFELDFIFNRTTYANYFSFDLLQVPCSWTLYQVTTVSGVQEPQQIYTGVVTAYNPTNTQTVELVLDTTYTFNTSTFLKMVITKNPTGTQYNLGLSRFTTKLRVLDYDDLFTTDNPTTVLSGLVTQNPLGFVESYNPVINSYSGMMGNNDQLYWKSPPQAVGDAIVYFIVDLGYQQTIDTLYIDPLYSGNSMNIYYSDVVTNVTDSSTLTWYPVNRDFTLKKGIYSIPGINARYIKLEFSRLTPEVYDLPVDTVQRTVQVYPDWVDSYFTGLEQAIPDISNQSYFPINTNAAPNLVYNTQPITNTNYGVASNQLSANVYGGSTTNGLTSNVNTPSSYTIYDPTHSYKTLQEIAGVGSVFNNSGDIPFINRRFFIYGPHYYKNVTLNQTWSQMYFAGIKYLSFYSSTTLIQDDHEEWIDNFYPTVISGTYYASANSIVGSGTTASFTSTGYTGLANTQVQTANLQTITPISSFKFAALNTDWQPFLIPQQFLLQGTPSITGVTISGSGYSVSSTTTPYGVYTISGNSSGTTYIESTLAGSQNLLTMAMANFTASGWSGSVPVSSLTTISGQNKTSIPLSSITLSPNVYADGELGGTSFGGAAQQATNSYTFLATSSGFNGTVTTNTSYYYNGTLVTTSGHTFTVASSGTQISFTTSQPLNTNQANFTLTPSGGTATFTRAGYFAGTSAIWSNPLQFQNMRMSAIARINLPTTNVGTYRCSLYNSLGQELAYETVAGIPPRTWVDIEVPFTTTTSLTNNNGFYVKLTQTNGVVGSTPEPYEVAMLGIFYNPIGYQFSSDGGTTWWDIITGVNDSNTNINLPLPSQQLMLRGIILQDESIISAIDIVPVYTQTPFYTSTIIDYLSDPKVNELSGRKPTSLHPLFQLSTDLFPVQYSQRQLMNISNPFKLIP